MKTSQRTILLDLLTTAAKMGQAVSRVVLEGYKDEIGWHYDRRIRELEEEWEIDKLDENMQPVANSQFIEYYRLVGKREPKSHPIPTEILYGPLPRGWKLFEVVA